MNKILPVVRISLKTFHIFFYNINVSIEISAVIFKLLTLITCLFKIVKYVILFNQVCSYDTVCLAFFPTELIFI